MESGIFTWKEIYPRPIEMSLKQKIQSMSGSLFQTCTWLLNALTRMWSWLVEFQLFKNKWGQSFGPISVFHTHFSVLSPFQRFIPILAFYPQFSVLSSFQCFIPISVFYPHFSVVSPFQYFIPISAFYPHFSVLSTFQRFILISVFYPHFSVLSPFQRCIPISVSVLSFRFSHSVSAFYPDPLKYIFCTRSITLLLRIRKLRMIIFKRQ